MITPAGKECKYFYGDYYRGRNKEECTLLCTNWTKDLCKLCPVPGIDRANACVHMHIQARVARPWDALFQKRVIIEVTCDKSDRKGFDPHIGCGDCHSFPTTFEVK